MIILVEVCLGGAHRQINMIILKLCDKVAGLTEACLDKTRLVWDYLRLFVI